MNNLIKPRYRLAARERSSMLFWLGFWALFAKFIWQSTVILPSSEIALRVLLLFGMLFLTLRILFILPYYNRPRMVIVSVAIAGLSYVLSGETVLLSTLLTLFAAAGIGSGTIMRTWCRAMFPILAMMLAVYGLAWIMGDSAGELFEGIGGVRESRSALFFVHPNYCAAFFFAFAISQSVRKDISLPFIIACYFVCLLVIFFVAGSRTSTIALLSFPIFAAVLRALFGKVGNRAEVGVSIALVILPVSLALFTYWIGAYWFTSPMFSQSLSDLLTGRPSLWWAQCNYAGLTLFGQEAFHGTITVRGTVQTVSTVDGLYSSLLFNIGIAGFVCILILAYRWGRLSITQSRGIKAAAILSIFLFGFCEWHALNVYVCVPLLLLGDGVLVECTREKEEVIQALPKAFITQRVGIQRNGNTNTRHYSHPLLSETEGCS